jgi:hypothetical protein
MKTEAIGYSRSHSRNGKVHTVTDQVEQIKLFASAQNCSVTAIYIGNGPEQAEDHDQDWEELLTVLSRHQASALIVVHPDVISQDPIRLERAKAQLRARHISLVEISFYALDARSQIKQTMENIMAWQKGKRPDNK